MSSYTEQTPNQTENEATEQPTFTRPQRATLLLLALAAYGVGWLAATIAGVFADVGYGGSLLNDPAGGTALIKAIVPALVVGVLGTALGRSIRPDVGLFMAAITFLAIRNAGGATHEVYLARPDASALFRMFVESLLLMLTLYAIHRIARHAVRDGWLADDAAMDGVYVPEEPPGQRLLATVTVALVVVVAMSILCRSDAPAQVLGALAISACLASLCTVRFIPATPSLYFWIAPLAIGALSYLVTAFTGTAQLQIGEPAGFLAALSRALPLDYASAGVAGSLYGYWVGRTMIPEDDRLNGPVAGFVEDLKSVLNPLR